ncbi:MAG: hypothetical protein SNI51_01050 [Rikenellaceae bacterium]
MFDALKSITKIFPFTTLFVLSLFAVDGLFAVPASPKLIKVTQDDGSTIVVRMQGDEKFHWISTEEGYAITKVDGYYYYVNYTTQNEMVISRQRVMVDGILRRPDGTIKKPSEGRVSPIISSPAARLKTQQPILQTYKFNLLNRGGW